MLKDSEILEGINAVICAAFPDRPVYVDVQPEDFKRPSFFIVSGRKSASPAAMELIFRTARYTVTVLETLDDATGMCSLDALRETQAEASALFYKPFKCGDRTLMAKVECAPIDDAANAAFTLTVEFYDDVQGDEPGEGEAPLMEQVHTRKRIKSV